MLQAVPHLPDGPVGALPVPLMHLAFVLAGTRRQDLALLQCQGLWACAQGLIFPAVYFEDACAQHLPENVPSRTSGPGGHMHPSLRLIPESFEVQLCAV